MHFWKNYRYCSTYSYYRIFKIVDPKYGEKFRLKKNWKIPGSPPPLLKQTPGKILNFKKGRRTIRKENWESLFLFFSLSETNVLKNSQILQIFLFWGKKQFFLNWQHGRGRGWSKKFNRMKIEKKNLNSGCPLKLKKR